LANLRRPTNGKNPKGRLRAIAVRQTMNVPILDRLLQFKG
jgi:hypothetical protein